MSEKFDKVVQFLKATVPAMIEVTYKELTPREYQIDSKKWTVTLNPADTDIRVDAKTTLDFMDIIYFHKLAEQLQNIRDVYDARDEVF